jgi:AAHS family 4-hydroxybenzoate transporter-like MFS transporter
MHAHTDAPASGIDKILDERPMSALQITTLALCALVAVLDGFDIQAIGFVAPAIADTLQVKMSAFGPAFSSGLFGLMIGSAGLAPLADRFGRKGVLVPAVFAFGACTLLTVTVATLPELIAVRFLTGLGLGAALPNIVAIASEFAPRRFARTCVTLLFCGMSTGAALGGLVAGQLLPRFGWQSVFVVGGLLPMVVGLVLMKLLPESIRFLAARPGNDAHVQALMARIAPGVRLAAADLHPPILAPNEKLPLSRLFADGMWRRTLLLWVPYTMNLIALYFIISWLPAAMRAAGMPLADGIRAVTLFSIGGVIGALFQGRMMNLVGGHRMLAVQFIVYTCLMLLLANVAPQAGLIFAVAGVLGLAVHGAQAGLNAVAAETYPITVRSTGVGWALAVGRIGSIAAPLLGGAMLARSWTLQEIFLASSLPAILAAAAVLTTAAMNRHERSAGHGVLGKDAVT